MVAFGQKGVVFGQKQLYSVKVVVFEQVWLYSGENGCIRAKVVAFVQFGCNRGKWLYSGEDGFLWTKVFLFGQSG